MKSCVALAAMFVYILDARHCVFGSDMANDFGMPKDCDDVREYYNTTSSGEYIIYPVKDVAMRVYCCMSDNGQGWMVISRRNNGSLLFRRGWREYMEGFGNLTGEMWLGNTNIHILASGTNCTIRLQVMTGDFTKSYIDFNYFTISDDTRKFIFYVGNLIRSEEHEYKIRVTADYEMAYEDIKMAYRDISEEVSWWLTYLSITDMGNLYVKNSSLPEGYFNWYELFLYAKKITMMLRCGIIVEPE